MNLYFDQGYERIFGTYPLSSRELERALTSALAVGYRAVDTAQMYGNEADVGKALKSCGINRDALCITTKVHPDNFTDDRFLPSVEQSLNDLQTDRVDVLLLHWPPIGGDVTQSLRLLELAYKRGLCRYIGVSNYNCRMMRQVKEIIETPLVTNQVEFHPLLDQSKLLACSLETGIPLSSYCSVARGEVFRYSMFEQIGESCGKSAAQVVLRWILQKGVAINTMSTREQNQRNNFELDDFTLSEAQMQQIDALGSNNYRIVDKTIAPWAPDFD